MTETTLSFSIGGLPPLSARGCKQSLFPCLLGDLRRTINGKLVFTGDGERRKYASTILGKDKAPPALEGLWPGQEIIVNCLSPLTQKIEGNGETTSYALERPLVAGSLQAFTHDKQQLIIDSISEQKVILKEAVKEKMIAYLSYRPRLTMAVVSFSQETDEWALINGWTLKLEEI